MRGREVYNGARVISRRRLKQIRRSDDQFIRRALTAIRRLQRHAAEGDVLENHPRDLYIYIYTQEYISSWRRRVDVTYTYLSIEEENELGRMFYGSVCVCVRRQKWKKLFRNDRVLAN